MAYENMTLSELKKLKNDILEEHSILANDIDDWRTHDSDRHMMLNRIGELNTTLMSLIPEIRRREKES